MAIKERVAASKRGGKGEKSEKGGKRGRRQRTEDRRH